MSEMFKTVKIESSDELVEKRSRFIGYAKPVHSEQEAADFVNEIKKRHWDARHNVYAYSLRQGGAKRCSDDGEPSGTAGMPVLDVIVKNEVVDVCVVVTRYFGGILLGTGGLVRAYSAAAKLGLEAARIVTMKKCALCEISCSYNQYGKLNTLILGEGGVVDDCDFGDGVKITFHISIELVASIDKEFLDATAGEVKTKILDEKYYEFS